MSEKVRRAGKPTRKSYLIFSFGLAAVVSGLIACQDGVRNSVDVGTPLHANAVSKEASAKNPFAHVGEEHNAEVDFVLREFSKKWKKNMKKRDVCAALNAITKKYLEKKGKSAEVERFYAADDPCNGDAKDLATGNVSKGAVARMSSDEDFSSRALDLVNEIQNIMLSSSSAADVAGRLGPINAEGSSMSANDAALVLGVSSIAQSSAAYWEANLETWVSTFSQGGNPPSLPFLHDAAPSEWGAVPPRRQINWSGISEVGWADVSGGVVGGIRGAFGGPGGILAGIGTGAAYSSIGAAIGQIVKIIQRM